jgi:hypothetical protein
MAVSIQASNGRKQLIHELISNMRVRLRHQDHEVVSRTYKREFSRCNAVWHRRGNQKRNLPFVSEKKMLEMVVMTKASMPNRQRSLLGSGGHDRI